MTQEAPLSLATLLMPILALIVISAVDSVEKDDDVRYRIFISSFGLAAIGPIAVVVILGILSNIVSIEVVNVVPSALLSVILIFILIIGVTVHETARGIEDWEKQWYLAGLVIVFLWYALLLYYL